MNLEEALRYELSKALVQEERAHKDFARPYSGHDATVAFYEARGYCRGLVRALELLESRHYEATDA
jgi:hypothetical protein